MTLSIKQKLIISLMVAVLAASILVGSISQWIARDLVKENMEQLQLPSLLKQIGNQVDREASVMLSVAHGIASNPDILAWSAEGADSAGERRLLAYLNDIVDFNELTVASFVDRQTTKYWNQDGFLRVLKNDEFDGWFFAYRDSGTPISLSLYNEPGQGYRLFANFQQVAGRGMSGVAKSVDELLDIINAVKIAQTGFVYLVDGEGTIIAHPDTSLLGKSKLSAISSAEASRALLQKRDFAMATSEVDTDDVLFASTYVEKSGWYVVAQVPEQELYASLNAGSRQIILWSIAIAGLFALLGIWLASSLTKPIESLADIFQQLGKGQGDLRSRIEVPEQKETARLVEGFNNFIDHLHSTIASVAKTSQALRVSAQEVASQSQQNERSTRSQRDQTIQAATALTEMGSTVSEVAQSATYAAQNANRATESSQEGRLFTQKAVHAISNLSTQVQSVSEVIQSLDEHTAAIGGILDTIRSISEQTNLLALNAAIEAARAGDHGRGFSVVADEVRTLAQRAAVATDEIQIKIDKFQQDSKTAVSQMQDSKAQTKEVVGATDDIDKLLQKIAEEIVLINDVNTQVATATEQQASVVEDISRSINEISTSSDETLNATHVLVGVSEKLDQLANELAQEVSQFKL
ncbi:methyl-accepting chemotaxis protein [Alteromonas sp. 1_MG-2023]|uniref:methyl-accepting chemotaxis protein n=1 Tax=Alteromonas sp. 1_MG-2023 TaxID=3062669 RepID=UPI0026E46A9E|nr:methyl-accepting chemotaxis protein [Alteromonas sp. 1_MG-2023]MDO6567792.1 methyl-accepting chemotaxis protein [Alteromonas sp. 1_MG-2023]